MTGLEKVGYYTGCAIIPVVLASVFIMPQTTSGIIAAIGHEDACLDVVAALVSISLGLIFAPLLRAACAANLIILETFMFLGLQLVWLSILLPSHARDGSLAPIRGFVVGAAIATVLMVAACFRRTSNARGFPLDNNR